MGSSAGETRGLGRAVDPALGEVMTVARSPWRGAAGFAALSLVTLLLGLWWASNLAQRSPGGGFVVGVVTLFVSGALATGIVLPLRVRLIVGDFGMRVPHGPPVLWSDVAAMAFDPVTRTVDYWQFRGPRPTWRRRAERPRLPDGFVLATEDLVDDRLIEPTPWRLPLSGYRQPPDEVRALIETRYRAALACKQASWIPATRHERRATEPGPPSSDVIVPVNVADESGSRTASPSQARLSALLEELEAGPRWLILTRLDDSDDAWALEYRDGPADGLWQAFTDDGRLAERVLAGWASRTPGWSDDLDWELDRSWSATDGEVASLAGPGVQPVCDGTIPLDTPVPRDTWGGQPAQDLSSLVDRYRLRHGRSPDLGPYVVVPERAGRSIFLLLFWLAAGLLCVLEFAYAHDSDCVTRGATRYCGEGASGAIRVEFLALAVTCLAVAAVVLWRLLFRRPGLTLGTIGLENRTGRLRTQRIRWADVIDLRVQDRWEWWVHRAWVMKATAPGDWITIRTSGLRLPSSVVEAQIEALVAAHRPVRRRRTKSLEEDSAPGA